MTAKVCPCHLGEPELTVLHRLIRSTEGTTCKEPACKSRYTQSTAMGVNYWTFSLHICEVHQNESKNYCESLGALLSVITSQEVFQQAPFQGIQTLSKLFEGNHLSQPFHNLCPSKTASAMFTGATICLT